MAWIKRSGVTVRKSANQTGGVVTSRNTVIGTSQACLSLPHPPSRVIKASIRPRGPQIGQLDYCSRILSALDFELALARLFVCHKQKWRNSIMLSECFHWAIDTTGELQTTVILTKSRGGGKLGTTTTTFHGNSLVETIIIMIGGAHTTGKLNS